MKNDKEMNTPSDPCQTNLYNLSKLECEFDQCKKDAEYIGIGDRREFSYFLCDEHAQYVLKKDVKISIDMDTNDLTVTPVGTFH